MFEFFKKRNKFPSAEELSRLSESALKEVKEKWIYFHQNLPLGAGIPLSQNIDLFAQTLSQFFQRQYPQLLLGGSQIFWMTIFTSVLESGTHPQDEVNAAVSRLQGKYGGM